MLSNTKSIAILFLHPGCNTRCTFCITDNALTPMRYDQALSLLDDLPGRGINSVVLGGGEPFLWEHGVLKLAREAKSRGFHVQIGTNGIALPEGFETCPEFDRLVLPIESNEPRIHNQMRIHPGGHHHVILERLETLRRVGRELTVSTVVTAVNAPTLPSLARFLKQYTQDGGRLHAWHLYKFIPQGRGGEKNADALDISLDLYNDACDTAKAVGLPFRVYKRRDMRYSKTVDFFWYEGEQWVAGSEVWAHETTSCGTAALGGQGYLNL